ncbi:hypothetical protein Golomagni_05102 [Golovinomyces magnicellulatus]|nr:hypothetical protein Golomagni_05102 [Golovinomyces magnicellulatus]
MAMITRLITKFDIYYAEHPILTMMVTNAVLGGVADLVAQSITSIRLAGTRRSASSTNNDSITIEFHELDRKNSSSLHELPSESRTQPANFDFERLTRFIAYGFLLAPAQFKWFQFLSRTFPVTKQSSLGSVCVATFFTVMTLAEGGGRRAISNKLRDMYIPTLKANYVVWPLVQMINFRLMPIQFQLPFVSTIGIAWTAYLSLSNASEEAENRPSSQPQIIRLP